MPFSQPPGLVQNFARSVSEILDKAASFTPEVQKEVVDYVCATVSL